MKIAIVTDSTSYLSKEEQEKYGIHIVHMPVMIDGKSYEEGSNISTDEFYEKLKTHNHSQVHHNHQWVS